MKCNAQKDWMEISGIALFPRSKDAWSKRVDFSTNKWETKSLWFYWHVANLYFHPVGKFS